ncbi:MAG: hypothetical protein K0B09_08065 [Bacteroidales bacterium]|nr:hypothetical protein [Bacteroidales bacterium]
MINVITKPTLFFPLLVFCLSIQIQAQTINLSKSHIPSNEPVSYVVDFLRLDSLLISSIEFQRNDIKDIRTESSEIIVKTRLWVVLDGVFLSTQKEKKEKLSVINKEIIESIERIDKIKASELFGKKGKNGALLIKTKKIKAGAFGE